ncbi:hypothetical protein TeGR_g6300, partial [Tetraparma gracilis]
FGITILVILVGLGLLTATAAQLYQLLSTETLRIQALREMSPRHVMDKLRRKEKNEQDRERVTDSFRELDLHTAGRSSRSSPAACLLGLLDALEGCVKYVDRKGIRSYFFVALPFILLIAVGAVVVGCIEGLSAIEAVYWAVVTLTTVGYGDITLTYNSSKWFAIFYLPFSLVFMSLYLGCVAQVYVAFHQRNILRLMAKMYRLKEQHERQEREDPGSELDVSREVSPPASPPALSWSTRSAPSSLASPPSPAENSAKRGNRFLKFSFRRHKMTAAPESPTSPTRASTDDENDGDSPLPLTSAHHRTCSSPPLSVAAAPSPPPPRPRLSVDTALPAGAQPRPQTTKSHARHSTDATPSSIRGNSKWGMVRDISSAGGFNPHKLRARVQKRFEEIIASEVAGKLTNMTIENDKITVQIDGFRQLLDRWIIPRGARQAFRAVSYEVLLEVGEGSFRERGTDAFDGVDPEELGTIFAPLLAAMGTYDVMQGWLKGTDLLREKGEAEALAEGGGGGAGEARAGGLTPTFSPKRTPLASGRLSPMRTPTGRKLTRTNSWRTGLPKVSIASELPKI